MALTSAQIAAIIAAGGTVGFNGQLIARAQDVPTDAQIAASYPSAFTPGNGLTAPQAAPVGAFGMVFNGTSWDQAMANLQGPLLASLARTAPTSSPLQTNPNHRGALITLSVTVAPTAPAAGSGLVPRIGAVDVVSGTIAYLNAPPTPIAVAGTYAFVVYPGATGGNAAQVVGVPLSRAWRLDVAQVGADSYTYSASFSLIL